MTNYKSPNLPGIFTQNAAGLREFDKNLISELGGWDQTLSAILDKGISFTQNVDCDEVSFTSDAMANAENTVDHGLGKVPTYFIVGSIDKAGIVYLSATPATSTQIFLKCNVASCAIKLILI